MEKSYKMQQISLSPLMSVQSVHTASLGNGEKDLKRPHISFDYWSRCWDLSNSIVMYLLI